MTFEEANDKLNKIETVDEGMRAFNIKKVLPICNECKYRQFCNAKYFMFGCATECNFFKEN